VVRRLWHVLIADTVDLAFELLSEGFSGVADLCRIFARVYERRSTGKVTL